LVLLLTTLRLALPASAAQPPPPPPSEDDGRDVVVLIGDSILQTVTTEARTLLEAQGWEVIIQWVGGTGLTALTPAQLLGGTAAAFDWQKVLADMEATYNPDVVVIVLGTNDVTSVSQGEPYGPHIDRLLSATDAPVVLWSECSTHTTEPWRNEACAVINAELLAAEERREGFQVLSYDSLVAADLAASESDGIHLTQYGQDLFAKLIADAVGPAPGTLETPPTPEPSPK